MFNLKILSCEILSGEGKSSSGNVCPGSIIARFIRVFLVIPGQSLGNTISACLQIGYNILVSSLVNGVVSVLKVACNGREVV